MTDTEFGTLLFDMLRGGLDNLEENRDTVNNLNVFPIPDGDTGDNMYMTFASGCKQNPGFDSVKEFMSETAKGMLLGARGNSGVILSQICAGIADGLTDAETIRVDDIGNALERGVEFAYRAVDKPVEGTILTVYRDAVRHANESIREGLAFDEYFREFESELRKSLERTPELLPVLKESGVVDSGGAGLLFIVEGMHNAIRGDKREGRARSGLSEGSGKMVSNDALSQGRDRQETRMPDLSLFGPDSVLEFGYCTETLLRLQNAKCDVNAFTIDDFLNPLRDMGDSIVAFKNDTIVKLHIHTKEPGKVLSYCQRFGEFLTLKIENMTLEHNGSKVENNFSFTKPLEKQKKYGVVVVAAGDGIRECFKELGADVVINGGQSMNPATDDFLNAFSEVNAKTIFVFPNNKNVILTARQAAKLASDADIRIIESRTIGEGYAALSMFDTSTDDPVDLEEELRAAMEGVMTGLVSVADRDCVYSGVHVTKGEYLGFCGDNIFASASNREDACFELAKELGAGKRDVLILSGGAVAEEDKVQALFNRLQKEFPRTEVIRIDGRQPIYDYMLILE